MHVPPRERPPVHEEAEPEVLARELPDVGAKALAGPQPAKDLPDHLIARGVVADEGDPPVGPHAAGRRLGDVVEESGQPQRLAAGHLVGQGGLELLGHAGGELPEDAVEVPLGVDEPGQHLEGVVEDVEVVEVALLDSRQGAELGEHRVEHVEPGRKPQAVQCAGRGHEPPQLGEHPLRGRLGEARGRGARQALRLGVGLEAQLRHEPHRPQDPQGVGLVGAGPEDPQAPLGQVGPPAVGIDRVPAARAAPPSRSP